MTAKAQIRTVTNAAGRAEDGTPVVVHFNPESLALTIRNTMEEGQRGGAQGRPPEHLVSATEVTLAVQLVFDTTMTGENVRLSTAQIAEMMRPGTVVPNNEGKKRPQIVRFEWNTFSFEGLISDYSETLDFFSAEGVPLRSNLSLSITKHEDAFPRPATGGGGGANAPTAPVAEGESIDDVASRNGHAGAGPQIAAANGEENLRNPQSREIAAPAAAGQAAAAAGAQGSPLRQPGALESARQAINDRAAQSRAALADAKSRAEAAGVTFSRAPANAGQADPLGLGGFAVLKKTVPLAPGAGLGGAVGFSLKGPQGGASLSLSAGVSFGGSAGGGFNATAAMIGGGEMAKVGKRINLADIIFKETA